MSDHSHQLMRETEAARILREQLLALAGDDEETIRDTIEGETGLHELIAKVVEEVADAEANIAAIKDRLETLRLRKERIEARVESRRAAILNAMTIGEIKKLELPIATLSRKPTPPKVQVIDETAIPSSFWKRSDPALDKK